MSDTTPTLLASREALVEALRQHDWHADDDFDWSRPCRHADHQFHAFCGVCSGNLGAMADALLASGVVQEPAEFVAGLVDQDAIYDPVENAIAVAMAHQGDWVDATYAAFRALAAALKDPR